jgi:hypothetical protein
MGSINAIICTDSGVVKLADDGRAVDGWQQAVGSEQDAQRNREADPHQTRRLASIRLCTALRAYSAGASGGKALQSLKTQRQPSPDRCRPPRIA